MSTSAATGLPALVIRILPLRYWTSLSSSPRFCRTVMAGASRIMISLSIDMVDAIISIDVIECPRFALHRAGRSSRSRAGFVSTWRQHLSAGGALCPKEGGAQAHYQKPHSLRIICSPTHANQFLHTAQFVVWFAAEDNRPVRFGDLGNVNIPARIGCDAVRRDELAEAFAHRLRAEV